MVFRRTPSIAGGRNTKGFHHTFGYGHIEGFHSRMIDEVLKMVVFADADCAKERILKWVEEYNRVILHSMLGNKTRMEVWNGKKG